METKDSAASFKTNTKKRMTKKQRQKERKNEIPLFNFSIDII